MNYRVFSNDSWTFLLIRSWSILLTCIIFLGCEAWDLVEYGIWWCIMTFHQFHPTFFWGFLVGFACGNTQTLPFGEILKKLSTKKSTPWCYVVTGIFGIGIYFLWRLVVPLKNLKCFSVGIGRSHLYHGGHKSGELIPIKQVNYSQGTHLLLAI